MTKEEIFLRIAFCFRDSYEDLLGSFGEQNKVARDYLRAFLIGFDPRSTAQFYNPFEEQVVQQTIDDVFKKGECKMHKELLT